MWNCIIVIVSDDMRFSLATDLEFYGVQKKLLSAFVRILGFVNIRFLSEITQCLFQQTEWSENTF